MSDFLSKLHTHPQPAVQQLHTPADPAHVEEVRSPRSGCSGEPRHPPPPPTSHPEWATSDPHNSAAE